MSRLSRPFLYDVYKGESDYRELGERRFWN